MLSHGKPTFCGTHEELMKQHGADASLEDIFFRATQLVDETQEVVSRESGEAGETELEEVAAGDRS